MARQIRLTNTLTRRKDVFQPIDTARVRLYACGPTVYDYAHIGNARPVIVFDVLFRLLRHVYGDNCVTYVRNITDVDDKINARAAQDFPDLPLNDAIRRLTLATERQFHDDVRALGVLTAEAVNRPGAPPRFIEPRATEHIGAMRRLIERLVENRHAYVAQDHVLFDVPSMAEYGRLSGKPLDEQEAGARVDVAPYKRSPRDFVLWKPSKPGEPSWESPAGIAAPGRPGWHIECSAMSWEHLGETFDIHAGGLDLIFPHHENEIAQSRCCFGTSVMANVWLHNGFLQVEGEKMSKSLGNFVTIRDVLADWPGEVVRLTMLKTHYRQPIDWTARSLAESKRELDGWAAMIAGSGARAYLSAERHEDAKLPSEAVLDAVADDLNMPAALTVLREEAKEARDNRHRAAKFLTTLEFLGLVRRERLGVFESGLAAIGLSVPPAAMPQADRLRAAYANADGSAQANAHAALAALLPDGHLDLAESGALLARACEGDLEGRIAGLIEARRLARQSRDWAASDGIRDELASLGVQLTDNKDGTTSWHAAR